MLMNSLEFHVAPDGNDNSSGLYATPAAGVPGAIVLERAAHCVFYGCTIAHLNGYGIEVLAGSTENVLAACVMHDAGVQHGASGGSVRCGGGCRGRHDRAGFANHPFRYAMRWLAPGAGPSGDVVKERL